MMPNSHCSQNPEGQGESPNLHGQISTQFTYFLVIIGHEKSTQNVKL